VRGSPTLTRDAVARLPAAPLLAACCLVSALLVLTPVPVGLRALVVLPTVLLVPGLCVMRRLRLREPLVDLALAVPVSAALLVAVAQAALYLDAWHPRAALVVLLLASAASLGLELLRSLRRGAG
jgi:hypothetical protein